MYFIEIVKNRGETKMKLDLTGQKFNQLTVIEVAEKTPRATFWRCLCDCGTETKVSTNDLTSGHTKSCGCLRRKSNAKDLLGQRFGRLVVWKRAGTVGSRALWRCKCDCGKLTNVRSIDLLSGNTKSCGCLGKHYALNH